MIEIPASVLRQVRNVFQRVVGRANKRQAGPLVVLEAGADGLTLRASGPDGAIQYSHAGAFDPVVFAMPLGLLADCEGRASTMVAFDFQSQTKLHLNWHDGVVPRIKEIQATKLPTQAFPSVPDQMQPAGSGLLAALHAAAGATDSSSSRYALACIQLRGGSGHVVATDGRQLFTQSGFTFPWSDELLVPGLTVFGSREMAGDNSVEIGRSEKHVTLVTGPWTIHLAIKEGRFPKVDDVVPAAAAATGRLNLHPADAQFLLDTIGRLPGDEMLNHPVTLDLNGQVIVRARSEGEPRPTEVILTNSLLDGDPLRLHSDRAFLAKAARLGFREFCLFGNGSPVLAQDGNRRYIWMPLAAEGVVLPADDAVRIKSPLASDCSSTQHRRANELKLTKSTSHQAKSIEVAHLHKNTRDRVFSPSTQASSSEATTQTKKHVGPINPNATQTPVEQVIALRDALYSATRLANELVREFKHQARQARIVKSTLKSLKQLQTAG